MTDWELVGSELWHRPLALRAFILIRAKANRHEVSTKGFHYPAGTWTTCHSEIAQALTWREGKMTCTPTKRQVRHAIETLVKAGLVEAKPLPLQRTPQRPQDAYPGVRITLIRSAGYEGRKSPQRTPLRADRVTTTRDLGVEEMHKSRGVVEEGPAPGSPSGYRGIGKAGAVARPAPNRPKLKPTQARPYAPVSQAELEALAVRYDLSLEAVRWLANDWRYQLWALRRGEVLEEPVRACILNLAAQAGADRRAMAAN